jgi:hypothetical protein
VAFALALKRALVVPNPGYQEQLPLQSKRHPKRKSWRFAIMMLTCASRFCRLSSLNFFGDKPFGPAKTPKLPPAAIPSSMKLALTALRTRSITAAGPKPPNLQNPRTLKPRSRSTTPKRVTREEEPSPRPGKGGVFRLRGVRAAPELDDEIGLLEARASRQSDVSLAESVLADDAHGGEETRGNERTRGKRRSSGAESEQEYWDRAVQEPLEALGELYHLDQEVSAPLF